MFNAFVSVQDSTKCYQHTEFPTIFIGFSGDLGLYVWHSMSTLLDLLQDTFCPK